MKVFDQEFLDKHYLNCHLSTFVRNGKLHDGYHKNSRTVSLSKEDVQAHNAGKTVIVIVGVYPKFETYSSLLYLRPRVGKFTILTQEEYPVSIDMFSSFKLGDFLKVSNVPVTIKEYQKHNKRFVLTEREIKSNYLIGKVDNVVYLLDKTKAYSADPDQNFRAYTSKEGIRYEYAINLSDCMPVVNAIGSFTLEDIEMLENLFSALKPLVASISIKREQEKRESIALQYEQKLNAFRQGEITEEELNNFTPK